jgi:hypothetical protein
MGKELDDRVFGARFRASARDVYVLNVVPTDSGAHP